MVERLPKHRVQCVEVFFLWRLPGRDVRENSIDCLSQEDALLVDFRGLRIGIILSGGNLDLDNLPWASLSGDRD